KRQILEAMEKLEERINYYIQIATQETTIIKRLSGVGMLTYEEALKLDAVGPTARASGVARDVRKDDPYAAYGEIVFNVITDSHCDVYGRTVVRLKELLESLSIIRQLVNNIPEGPISVRVPRKIPAGEALSRYEAPRGEDVHYVRSNGTEKPDRVKVRAPTLANIQAVKQMLKDRQLADMPIVVAAIDPCFSCTDRMVAMKSEKGASVIKWQELRNYSIEWYKKHGVDFTELNKKLA
ncbi:MAG: NADH dehydrogenase subunit, partial [Candidatus Omnitrophica bacterium]|nr:NADH dehydrogenase subunit [Candidatus Omnitrophota bacterium]